MQAQPHAVKAGWKSCCRNVPTEGSSRGLTGQKGATHRGRPFRLFRVSQIAGYSPPITTNSTRRFMLRPSGVSFVAMGRDSPKPRTTNRLRSNPGNVLTR